MSYLPSGSPRPHRAGPNALVPSIARRSSVAWTVLLLAVAMLGLATVAPAADAADRDFAPRFSVNDTGDIDIFGNTLMTCPASASGCAAAQQSGVTTTADSSSQNNAYNMQYIDVDGDSSTFNSSRATVSLPSGSTVLFAGLYWGARTAAGSGGSAARDINARNRIKFRAPGASGYTTLTADTLDDGTGGIYQGYEDVTSIVKAAGAGVYTAADVQASTGADTLAGWSLVIAYRDTAQPARNLTVFDGIKSISSGASGTINVSGFTTPPAGDVRTRVGFVNYEGDGGIVGDSASLNSTVLSDAQHPATNFFNSRSSRDGVRRTATEPNYPNQLGIEQSILLANNVLANNATSATIRLTSSGDVYAPGVVTFATELYAPKVEQTKTVVDVNGGDVEQGDVLRYTIAGKNTGQDGAKDFIVRDPIPANTTYVPGSLKLSAAAGGTVADAAVTDGADTDRGEYDAANGRVVARVGTGASGTAGGVVPVSGTASNYAVTFDVKVGGPSPSIPSATTISNVATASFASQSLGTPLTAQSTATATVKSPDLTLTKAGQGTIVRGQAYTYRVTVANEGDAKTQGAVTVTDTLPTGLTAGANAATGTGWTCTNTSTTFTCTRSDALAAGATYPAISLVTNVASDAPATIANTAAVAGGGDGDVTNNTGTATNGPTSQADLSVSKTTTQTSVPVGSNVTYTLKVTNTGPSRSAGSVVTDALPAGLTYVSSSTGCVGAAASSTVTCTVGALASGASVEFTVVAKPAAGTAGSALRNTASVTGNDPDPTAGNNSSTVSVDVRPVDLRITNTIEGAPATLNPNTTYTWLVGVANDGGSAAPSSVVRFDVPAGAVANPATLDSRCSVTGATGSQIVTCNLGTIEPGATTGANPIRIPLTTTATPGAAVATSASVTTTETDRDLSNNTANTSTPVAQSVDLGVTLTAAPGPVRPGENLTLTAVTTNNGPARPGAPKVTIPLPSGTTFVSAPAGCALNGAGTAVVCDLTAADLDKGESITTAVVVKVGPNPGPTIAASATVSTTSADTNSSNDSAAVTVPVIETVDLGVTLTATPGTALPGQNLTLTAVVKNDGPGRPIAPTVTVPLPSGTTFVSAPAGCALNGAGTAVVCTLTPSDLDSGESVTRGIVVKVGDTPGASIAAEATVSTTSVDTNTANDRATTSVPVNQTVDLGVTIAATPSPVRPGENLTLTTTITNTGAARPVAPTVTIPLPSGTTFVSAPAGCAVSGSNVVCTLPAADLDAGESLTRAIVVKVGANPGPSIAASASVATTSTDVNPMNNLAATTVPVVETVDLGVTLTPDRGTVRAGENLTLTAVVKNTGPGSPAAPKVEIPLPAGTTLVSAPAGCQLNGAGTTIVCDLTGSDLGTNKSVTREIVVKVGDNPGATIAASAKVSTTSVDTNTANDTASTTVQVLRDVDLGVTLTADPNPTSTGENLTLTAVVKNLGDVRPTDPKVTIPVPAGTTFVSAPAGCALNGDGTAVVCDLTASDLDAGESITKAIVVKVTAPAGTDIRAEASVTTTSTDKDPSNNRATATVPVTAGADVEIRKSTTASIFQAGDTVGYTLTARNNGPATARDVVVTDTVPADLDVVSVTPADSCNVVGNAVTCKLDSLAANTDRTVAIQTRAKAVAPSPAASGAHKIKASREEVYVDVPKDAERTIELTCTDGIATDGTVQVVGFTTGQSTAADAKDVAIVRAASTSSSTYSFLVRNDGPGTAGVRPHVTCLTAKTADRQHDLVVGPLRTQTRSVGAGRQEFVFPVANGDRAVAPGIETSGGRARLVGSEPVPGGWKLIVDVLEPATVTASLRDLDDLTSASGDPLHVHALVFTHESRNVVVPANSRLDQERVQCPVGYDGIVASYELPEGVVSLGNIPMPVNRDFFLLNTTGQAQTVKIDLECIRLDTGDPIVGNDVVNTATIATTTSDTNPDNNRSSARIVVERKPAPVVAPTPDAPAPAPAPAAPAPDATVAPDPSPAPSVAAPSTPASPAAPSSTGTTASVLSTALRVTGTAAKATVAVPVRCAKACTGTAKLVATSALRSAGIKKGAVLATASVKLTAGKKSTLRLVAKGKVAKALKRGGVKRAKLVVSTGKGKQVTKTVRLVLK